jgi:hypothetical protein
MPAAGSSTPPAPDGVAAWRALLLAQSRAVRAIEADLDATDARQLSWYDVLLELQVEPEGLRMQDLGDRAVLSRTRVSRLVDELEVRALPSLGVGGWGMAEASGFAHVVRKSGEVVVTHHGVTAALLRGKAAEGFLADLERSDDPQLVMARVTGNYRRGNERTGAQHQRNRRR